MASQALYRRYRSQTFGELVGQEHIVKTLRNALAEGRVAHAYLFTGPRGVGKTSVARLLAKAVNCTAPMSDRPCGVCDSCVAVADGSAVDVIEMDAASHTSVEDAREIIERVQFRPTQGTYKVYIIDEVHMLSTAAFNALLKTLEEPPGHALFILATTEVHKVPKTILSRCQQFVFNRHTITSTAAHLNAVADEEGFTLEAGAAESIARSATGSMRDALSILDQLMSYGDRQISVAQVRSLLGSSESQEVAALIDALIAGDTAAGLRAVAGVAAQGADLRQFNRDIVDRLRALMLLKASNDASLLDLSEDDAAQMREQARMANVGALLQWVKLFSGLDTPIRQAAIPQLPIEMAVVEALCAPAPAASVPQPRATTPPTARPQPRPAAIQSAAVRPAVQEAPAREAPRPPAPQPTQPAPVAQSATSEPLPGPQISPADERRPVQEPSPVSADEPPPTPDTAPFEPPPTREQPAVAEPETAPVAASAEDAEQAAQNYAADNADVVALERVEALWSAILRDIRVQSPMAQGLLNSGARVSDVKDNELILEFRFPKHVEMFEKHRRIVEDVVSKHMGASFIVRGTAESQEHASPNQLREQIRKSRKDPLIKAAINIFGADIIAVEQHEGA